MITTKLSKDSTPKEVQAAWADVLQNAELVQTKGLLKRTEADGNDSYCCLGVLSEMAVTAGVIESRRRNDVCDSESCGCQKSWEFGEAETAYLPVEVGEWAFGEDAGPVYNPTLIDENGLIQTATTLNDTEGYSFPQIGAAVRRTYLND